jgi:hypothetical protein
MIGCTTLLAVSGILRTLPGRRGSGPGPLGRAGLRPYHAISSTRADATSATAPGPGQAWAGRVVASATSPGPLCGWGGAHCALSPGRRRALPISQWSWVSAGLPVGAPDRRHASPLMSPQGAAVGRGPGWRDRGWIAISTVQGAAGLWSRAYHWHVALVPGPPDAHGGRVLVSRPVAGPLAAGGDSNGRKPSSAAARLGRCGPRDRPVADRRPGARLDRGLGVGSSTGSLRSR